ncbi:hypothetical protein RSW84_29150, partial [Escherichia coli]|uniref:hypothetical protein n=1 Tax=Escherichia coli TaxID=562 RepID=UPI0028DEA96B
ALKVLDKLKVYQLSEEAWARHKAEQAELAPRNAPKVEFVKVENRSAIATKTIEAMVTQKAGEPLDAARMTEDLQDIYALG